MPLLSAEARVSQNHRTVWLEGTFKDLCNEQGNLQLDPVAQCPSNLTLSLSKDGASTTSLCNLFQCVTTCIIKELFPISSVNLQSFSLKRLPLVLSQKSLLKIIWSSSIFHKTLKKLLINTTADLPEKQDMAVPMKYNHMYEMLRHAE